MSKISPKEVLCTRCGSAFRDDLWDSVNTDTAELVDAFVDGTLNTATCPDCGITSFIPTPVLYHDVDHGLMILVGPSVGAPRSTQPKFETGIEGVRYRCRVNRPVQMIHVEDFELARRALGALADEVTVRHIAQAHPGWSQSVVYAEAFLVHCRALVARLPEG